MGGATRPGSLGPGHSTGPDPRPGTCQGPARPPGDGHHSPARRCRRCC